MESRPQLRMYGHWICFLFPHFWGKSLLFLKSDKFGVKSLTFSFFPNLKNLSLSPLVLPFFAAPSLLPNCLQEGGKRVLGRSLEKEVFFSSPTLTLLGEERPLNPNAWPVVMVLCARPLLDKPGTALCPWPLGKRVCCFNASLPALRLGDSCFRMCLPAAGRRPPPDSNLLAKLD